MRRIGALAVGLATVTALSFPMAPPVVADPAGGGGAAAASPTLSLADLGAGNAITFNVNRDNASTSVTFPVPTGLVPVALKAKVELPANLRSGTLAVSQGDRTIARLPLPARDLEVVTIPLAGVQVFGNWATLNLRLSALPLETYCWDPEMPIRLVNGSIAFAGNEKSPTTVAEFLPPVLRKVTIAIPAKPSPAETNAAVQLAAVVAARSGQSPEVAVVALPDGATALPTASATLERQIIVKDGAKKGLSLQGGPVPALLISGQGNELAEQVRLLDNEALQYAVSSGSAAESLPDQQWANDSTTLAQLNRAGNGLRSEALWPTVGIELDQTRWGHAIDGISVHVIGSYTPLPSTFGGEVTISVGGEVIDRWPVEAAGRIDRTVTVADRLLKRLTVVEVAVRTTGDPGHCGDHLPITLRVDGGTAIRANRANPPSPQGFQSFPQAVMPRILVGIGADTFGDTARAAQIMVGLRRASGVPLTTEVTTLQDAIDSGLPAVLVSAGGWKDTSIALPFNTDHGRITVTGVDPQDQSVTLNLDPEVKFGSLHAFFDGQRSLLVATSNGAPAQLDELLRYLAAEPGRWSGLNGRAVISASGQQPITVPLPPIDYSAQAPQPSSAANWFWWAAGGIAAVAALGAVAILMRARRS